MTGDLSDAALLDRHVPIIRFTQGEYFLPLDVESYIARCQLWRRIGTRRRQLVAEAGTLDPSRLVQLTAGVAGEWSLVFVAEPLNRAERLTWRLRADRPRFAGASRLGSVGVLSRVVDSVMRSSLFVRGRVAAGASAAAETACRDLYTAREHPYYGRVVRQAGYVVLQYWFFYPFNDWRSRVSGVNDHEADWEQVTIYLSGDDLTPTWVVFSAHDETGDNLRRRWDDPDMTLVDGRPVVHAGLGSHSGAYLAGDYLVTVETPVFHNLVAAGRRLAQLFLPWAQETDAHGLRVPYVDYSRGDGECIGEPDGARRWRQVMIDDETPWVTGYLGLWGRDTDDPLGGERGPAGPRYDRDGTVRPSWGDPVGWAGLEKVSSSEPERLRVVGERLAALVDERAALERAMGSERVTLRAGALPTAVDIASVESSLLAHTAELTRLDDEERRLRTSLTVAPPLGGPHDHLTRRHLPMEPADTVRRRVLAAWAMLSTPLLLAILAVLVLPLGPSIAALSAVSLFVVFAVEAVARGKLLAFVTTAVALVAGGALLFVIVIGLLSRWQYTLAGLLLAAAAIVFVVNVAELRRR